jgi:hypothetical protein
MLRANTAQSLIRDSLAIQAQKEAWILEGPDVQDRRLSKNKDLTTEPSARDLWLRQVEIRTALDEAKWNAAQESFYGIIDGRRVWIVRDTIAGRAAYEGAVPRGGHPALLSSKAMEELCGWVERVAASRRGWLLSRRDLVSLRPLLAPICTSDRLEVFGTRMSERAIAFLKRYSEMKENRRSI